MDAQSVGEGARSANPDNDIAVGIYVLVQETAKEVKTAVEESLLRSYNLEEAERMREGQSTVIYDL